MPPPFCTQEHICSSLSCCTLRWRHTEGQEFQEMCAKYSLLTAQVSLGLSDFFHWHICCMWLQRITQILTIGLEEKNPSSIRCLSAVFSVCCVYSALNHIYIRTRDTTGKAGKKGRWSDLFGCFYSGLWINYAASKPDPLLWARHFGISLVNNAVFCLSF